MNVDRYQLILLSASLVEMLIVIQILFFYNERFVYNRLGNLTLKCSHMLLYAICARPEILSMKGGWKSRRKPTGEATQNKGKIMGEADDVCQLIKTRAFNLMENKQGS